MTTPLFAGNSSPASFFQTPILNKLTSNKHSSPDFSTEGDFDLEHKMDNKTGLSLNQVLVPMEIDGKTGVNKGKACDNCRAKKIKCDFGYPCDKCLKRESKNRKRAEKTGVHIPLLKCTYAYELTTVKKKCQTAEKRVSEKQIFDMVKDKIDSLEFVLKERNYVRKLKSISQQSGTSAFIKLCTSSDGNSCPLKELDNVDKEEMKKKETQKTLEVYSKIVENEINSRRLLRQIKGEQPFSQTESENQIGKKSTERTIIKKMGSSFVNNRTTTSIDNSKNLIDSKPQDALYLEQEKERFNSSFAATQVTSDRSLKSRIADVISPQMLKNALKTPEEFEKIVPVLSKIKYLIDLLKTDSEIYLQKLFQKIEKPFYIGIPDVLLDYLLDLFTENTLHWYTFLTEKDIKVSVEKFRNNQKGMDETEIFLINTILLLACQLGKGVIYKTKNPPKNIDSELLITWENIFLLNCISFYQRFLIFPAPTLNEDDRELNILLKITIRKLQSMYLLGYYFNNSPAPRLFVHLFSIVLTVAQDFHFDNLDFYGDKILKDLKLQAQALWICCFISEKHISVTFGKPEFIMGFDNNMLDESIFIDYLSQFGIKCDSDMVVDYSNDQTSWMLFLKNIPLGEMLISWHLRLELLQIETIYYRTVIAAKNEGVDPVLMVTKCNYILKSFDIFEEKARKLLRINADQTVDDWLRRLPKQNRPKFVSEDVGYLFLTLYSLKLNSLIVMVDLEYKMCPEMVEGNCKFQVELHNISSMQLSLLDHIFEKSWPVCVGSEIIICFLSALSPLFYNCVLDKGYFRLNIHRMIKIIKKFAGIGLSNNFFDPLKWNSVTLLAIFYMKILYIRHPDVYAESFTESFTILFLDEYTNAFNIIKAFKAKMINYIEASSRGIAKLPEDMKIGISKNSYVDSVKHSTYNDSSLSSLVVSKEEEMFTKNSSSETNPVESVGFFSFDQMLSNTETPRIDSISGQMNTPMGLFSKYSLNNDYSIQNKLMDMLDPSSINELIDDHSLFNEKDSKFENNSFSQKPIQFKQENSTSGEHENSSNLMDSNKNRPSNMSTDLNDFFSQNFLTANHFRSNAYTEDDLFFNLQ
ncbi:hypothetical protein QEN19_003436 [Hanseniaspora menglaensis]